MLEALDPYYYARDHKGGPGAWCVRGPNGFQIEVADKCVAYIIGKLLSDKLVDAKQLLDDLVLQGRGRDEGALGGPARITLSEAINACRG